MTALASRCYDILLHTHSARNMKAESSLCSSCERTQFLIFPPRCHVTIIPIQRPEHCYSPSARVSHELPNSTTSVRWKVLGRAAFEGPRQEERRIQLWASFVRQQPRHGTLDGVCARRLPVKSAHAAVAGETHPLERLERLWVHRRFSRLQLHLRALGGRLRGPAGPRGARARPVTGTSRTWGPTGLPRSR